MMIHEHGQDQVLCAHIWHKRRSMPEYYRQFICNADAVMTVYSSILEMFIIPARSIMHSE